MANSIDFGINMKIHFLIKFLNLNQMLTHNNPEFLKELFKFFPDKEAGIRDCYLQFMKSVAKAEGLAGDQAPSLETFISK